MKKDSTERVAQNEPKADGQLRAVSPPIPDPFQGLRPIEGALLSSSPDVRPGRDIRTHQLQSRLLRVVRAGLKARFIMVFRHGQPSLSP